ncbi:hypothetical protein ABIE65_000689 [Constrictibacter sp. MBR-5]|jgi:hypothetical protein|uniref:hypothetical protein n=1 Tax=Constrictibacter sp. MBR-5 TaxID=3156467 RepID=UPI003393BABD
MSRRPDPTRPGQRERALVAFADETRLKRLLPLRPGFRHCFVLLERRGAAVLVDPLSDRMAVEVFPGMTLEDAAERWRDAGFTVVGARVREPGGPAPAAPLTCVEVVKRTLGIHARGILTPHRLYQTLEEEKEYFP